MRFENLDDSDSEFYGDSVDDGMDESDIINDREAKLIEEDLDVLSGMDMTDDGSENNENILGQKIITYQAMDELKEKEKNLMQRKQVGYYRCKIKHKNANSKNCEAYSPYIPRDILYMLYHKWYTKKNEALNKSVASYAPKDRTFSRTQSLHTRVSIAVAVQVCGYFKSWSQILEELNVPMDENFAQQFRIIDTVKYKKNARAATKEGESRRSRKRREKLKRAQELDKEAQKVGLAYESGIALSEVKKAVNEELANAKRHPPGTPKEK